MKALCIVIYTDALVLASHILISANADCFQAPLVAVFLCTIVNQLLLTIPPLCSFINDVTMNLIVHKSNADICVVVKGAAISGAKATSLPHTTPKFVPFTTYR